MPRRGRYGQLPPAAPSLTSTIIAIARQMQADREHNLMDAWKNGGSFEGKPVTDDMVLDYWREQLKGIDKEDPLYDTYSNTILQTDYSIQESKMSTWYAQSKGGAADDRKMADFYSKWAAKIPKNSEFYRVLQRDSAQFIRSAIAKEKVAAGSSGGGGGGRRSGGGSRSTGGPTKAQLKAKAYGDAQVATYTHYERTGDFLTSTFTNIAKGNALIGMATTQDLQDFDPNDPGAMLDIIDQINLHPDSPVYFTAQGAVTGKMILAQLKTLDPHFAGKLTVQYFGQALGNKVVGLNNRLDLATSTNHKTDMKAIAKSIGVANEIGRESNAWGIEESYQHLRSAFLRTWLDPTSTPDQKVSAWSTYSKGLVGLATSKTHPPDQNTFTRIIAEANGDGSVDSLAENFTGLKAADHSSVNGGSTGDIADTHASLTALVGQQQAVATGQAVWAYGTTDSAGVFRAGAGREIGAASPVDVSQSSPEGAIQVWVTQGDSNPIPVWVAGKTVTASVVDANGRHVGATNPDDNQVATAYDVTIDGHTTRLYGYEAAGGRRIYTTDAPWGENVQVHDTGGAVQLTVRLGGVPSEQTVAGNPAFSIVRDENGDIKNITVDPGQFVITQTDPVRYAAGPDPHVDSLSPSIALYIATPESRSELHVLQGNADFNHTVDLDLRLAAGGQYDPATGHVIGGDPAVYNEGAAQVGFANRMNDPRTVGLGPAGGEVFFPGGAVRHTFETPVTSIAPFTGGPSQGLQVGDRPTSQLPSDAARGTAFDGLAGVFQLGTNRIQPATAEPKDSLLIQGPNQLRVPAPPKPSTTPQTVGLAPLPVQPPQAAPLPIVPPGPTDKLTPVPIAPTPTPVTPPAPLKPPGPTDKLTPLPTLSSGSLPQPLAPRSGRAIPV